MALTIPENIFKRRSLLTMKTLTGVCFLNCVGMLIWVMNLAQVLTLLPTLVVMLIGMAVLLIAPAVHKRPS